MKQYCVEALHKLFVQDGRITETCFVEAVSIRLGVQSLRPASAGRTFVWISSCKFPASRNSPYPSPALGIAYPSPSPNGQHGSWHEVVRQDDHRLLQKDGSASALRGAQTTSAAYRGFTRWFVRSIILGRRLTLRLLDILRARHCWVVFASCLPMILHRRNGVQARSGSSRPFRLYGPG